MRTITEFPRKVRVIEDLGIVMPDGCRLSARLWLPVDAEDNPVPVILEHLPYRKRDGTIVRDSLTHPWMAGQGYACLRTDMRGNGDSQGLMEDEYTLQEWQDACAVLEWAAAQSWSNGKAGMMGISWGGFNALQVAALRPPSLKAIITLCSTVDRFADDIHFKGGCLLGENFGWAATMLAYSSRPPDPMLVGEDDARSLWMQRLEAMPFLAREWIDRQARDGFWKHGSVCEDYSAIEAATLSIGGWHDGYRNTISHLVSNLDAPVKGIVGPWIHKYPHFAAPKPAIDFLGEAKRWWDRWLKDIDTGVENDPAMRLWLMDSVKPERWLPERPGRWIAETDWPSKDIEARVLHLGRLQDLNGAQTPTSGKPANLPPPLTPPLKGEGDGRGLVGHEADEQHLLAATQAASSPSPSPLRGGVRGGGVLISEWTGAKNAPSFAIPVCSPQDCGAAGGEYFPFAYGPELPDDQSADDARSVCFDGETLAEPLDIVGAPTLAITAASDKPRAQLAVRLCDLRPDGTSALITMGVLNLTHRNGSENPQPLVEGETFSATVTLDQIAYRVPAGHRLRIAVSTTYWPFIWPSPQAATVTLHSGSLSLPVRNRLAEASEWHFGEPQAAKPWNAENLRPATSTREIERDAETGVLTTIVENDSGEDIDNDHGLITGSRTRETWSIHPDDPLSAHATSVWEKNGGRGNCRWQTRASMDMRCDRENFHLTGELVAEENGHIVFQRRWNETVPRRFV